MNTSTIFNTCVSLIICLLFLTTDIVAAETNLTEQENFSRQAVFLDIQNKINSAMEKAAKEGKNSVDINLEKIPGLVGPGDIVKVACSVSTEDGRSLFTLKSQSADQMRKKSVIAGTPGKIPGLSESLVGMINGEKKQVIIEPENAFGKRSDGNRKAFPAIRVLPRIVKYSPEVYEKKLGLSSPQPGDIIQVNPYFKSEVISVSPDQIVAGHIVKNGAKEKAPFGTTLISLKEDQIIMTLKAEKGASFQAGNKTGIITSVSEEQFIVDFNHPFAGQKLILDVEILDIIKKKEFENTTISWINDHDAGYASAVEQHKNKVLVLYADWCSWCKKLFSQTLTDPRILVLKDDFVWVKANSDNDESLKALYSQDGFPMIVLTDSTGTILKKIEGYKDADALVAELEQIKMINKAETEN